MGGTGGGHYTAYAKSPICNQWMSFNDSSVKRINATNPEDVVIGSSAYSLFYRRRDPAVNLTAVDFAAIKQVAHTEFLENLEKRRKAAKEATEGQKQEWNKFEHLTLNHNKACSKSFSK